MKVTTLILRSGYAAFITSMDDVADTLRIAMRHLGSAPAGALAPLASIANEVAIRGRDGFPVHLKNELGQLIEELEQPTGQREFQIDWDGGWIGAVQQMLWLLWEGAASAQWCAGEKEEGDSMREHRIAGVCLLKAIYDAEAGLLN